MEASLRRAEQMAPALYQRVDGEGDQRPQSEGTQQDDKQADVEPRANGLIHRAGTLLLVGGIGITQLVWVGGLGYGAVWVWQRIPL